MSEPVSRVRAFLGLPRDQQLRLLLAAALLPVVGPATRLLGVRRVHRVLADSELREDAGADRTIDPIERSGAAPADLPDSVHAVRRAVRTADRRLPGSRRCLARSLVAVALLERAGHEPVHRIGVRSDGDGIAAHSWVEVEGAVVVGALEDLDGFAAVGADGARTADEETE